MKSPIQSQQIAKQLRRHDPIWPVQLTILAAIILQISLPEQFTAGSRILMPVLEGILLIVLSVTHSRTLLVRRILRRINVIAVLVLMAISNIYALQQLSHELLVGGKITNGHELIRSAINIYLTNIIIFALVYWAIDGGGAAMRASETPNRPDFLFVEMSLPQFVGPNWFPSFVDYLALSGNTALAFSPTDTMPLTRRAKLLMLVQAFVSLVIVGLVAARAVNILK